MGVWSPGLGPTSGDDTYTGDGVPDEVGSLEGNDTLIGAGGPDRLDGGSGFDTAFLDYASEILGITTRKGREAGPSTFLTLGQGETALSRVRKGVMPWRVNYNALLV